MSVRESMLLKFELQNLADRTGKVPGDFVTGHRGILFQDQLCGLAWSYHREAQVFACSVYGANGLVRVFQAGLDEEDAVRRLFA